MTVAEIREELHAAGRDWWVCRCGRPMIDHSMRTIPSTGGREHVCTRTGSGRFEPVTLPELGYSPEKGLHVVEVVERAPRATGMLPASEPLPF